MRRDFPITPNFRLAEFEISSSFPQFVEGVPDKLLPNVIRLAVTVLQPLRQRYGRVQILSGYRAPRLNSAVGGSATSQHTKAEAADCVFGDNQHVFDAMRSNPMGLVPNAGQIIHYPESNFIHIALPSERYTKPTFFVSRAGKLTAV